MRDRARGCKKTPWIHGAQQTFAPIINRGSTSAANAFHCVGIAHQRPARGLREVGHALAIGSQLIARDKIQKAGPLAQANECSQPLTPTSKWTGARCY
eukprot:7871662-Pyramimonas_sp.AAC.1